MSPPRTEAATEILGLLEKLSAGAESDGAVRHDYDCWQAVSGLWSAQAGWLAKGRWPRVVFTGARSRAEAEGAVLATLRQVAGGGR